MDKDLVLLTLGSARQSRELNEAAERLGYQIQGEHVREDVKDWEVRDTEKILSESVEALARLPRQPDAILNFGRATVPDGIRRIAVVMEQLRADGQLAENTKLIGPSARSAHVWGDKAMIAESLTSLALPIPVTVNVDLDSVAELGRKVDRGEFPAPIVVKVVDLTGGSGMRYAADSQGLVEAVRQLSRSGRRLVATEFVIGDEVSVDLLRLGTRTLLYPPGFKRVTDTNLTHADHKIKVNGLVRGIPEFSRDMLRIAEAFDLQGFFSLEAVITSTDPIGWHILEGATRITNNIQMQDASLRFDSFGAVLRYIAGQEWCNESGRLGLALSIPIYQHKGLESVQTLSRFDWVRQVKLEDLAQMPESKDARVRLTAKVAVHDLDAQLAILAAATGDMDLPYRVQAEVERLRDRYVR